MYILGLNDSTSAAAIIKEGKLIAAAREERFNRVKFSDSYPMEAVDYCLGVAGVTLKDIEHIVFAWNPGHEIEPQDTMAAVRYHKHFLHYIPNNLLRHIGGDKSNKRITRIDERIEFLKGELNIHFIPHHYSHAASAFFVSPYEKAAVFTIDAYGDDITHQFFIGEGNNLDSVGKTMFPHSMGQVYAAITQYLGYRTNSDEWKIMGLAAYGEPEYYDQFAKIINFDKKKGELRFDLDFFTYYIWSPRRYSDKFIETFGSERYPNEELTKRHINIAASFQKRVEDIALDMCVYLAEKTKLNTLCLAGGVAMNSKMNGRILSETPFTKVWVQPSADDAGCSLGACFYYWNQILRNKRSFVMEHDYWGPGFSDTEIKEALDDSLVFYECLENPEKEAAKSISENKVIAWFQGRMEFGQRALGNRSILADARDPGMKEKINRLIKHREWYRPFAPSVMEEFQKDYFTTEFPSSFMQMVYPVREEKRAIIPAVVHKDGTARLQTVNKDINHRYWKLIDEFRKITGVALILNTSFNDNDEPIVCTPNDAIRTFFGTGIHELYIGNYRVVKSKQPAR
ncbi:MAG: carbamoyltransferase C-terminal domain-containing protein [Candidatus Omnitrophica bacterium]|nr:carbamoyltransferase C-terminal domain-containing protein [Candidatus Omnitrophota bacterium]MDD5352666.1 carbamoyltransferase C-terminal domain-containing protein [Candidatus Omnitrophota bacterium]MDD5550265.1 carbamoyltransferase C-terminal domain-containing protein [Candidatus Omnitrophota bacterium]